MFLWSRVGKLRSSVPRPCVANTPLLPLPPSLQMHAAFSAVERAEAALEDAAFEQQVHREQLLALRSRGDQLEAERLGLEQVLWPWGGRR